MKGLRGSKRQLAIVALLALLSAGLAFADGKPEMKKLKTGTFTLETTPIASFGRGGLKASTGKLEWRGGLVLTSPHKNFGGWSGLVLDPDGRRFLSISDAGAWMTGELNYQRGVVSGIANPRMGPLLSKEGVNLSKGKDRDAEAIALQSGNFDDGELLVAFERNARIARYGFTTKSGVTATKGFLPLPEAARGMSRNGGFEAMTVIRGGNHSGSVIAFSERMKDENGNRVGWLWGQRGATEFKIKDIGGYDISDVASLEDGSLILLERRFRWLEGLYIRLRLVPAKDVGLAQTIEGQTLLEADLSQEIDNMEGLAISRDASGTAVLTLISDDNFNRSLQRTLLLQFAYPDDPARDVARAVTAKARP